ncbi:exodeoxyribonuclease VII large subunit [Candidatus Poribacteria bacterium]|nr:exodeoxyribonuclease VII large subunit [Candidatus Poribacteria bacterium]MYA98533.1 exodeoxyribonuclease VII large subunit [Candidatus Poribacteria bacterium]
MQLEFSMPTRTVQSVSDITNLLKRLIEQHPPFKNVWVQGQVSNYSRSGAGHVYFTLKDANSQISVALFRNNASRLKFLPKDGEEVIVQGQLGLYATRGQYQIIGQNVEPVGIGALQRAFEALKQQLADEGLFDNIHKKRLPKFPQKIGVITSATGAAFQDICEQLRKRYPVAEVLLHPSLVQGDGAAQEIADALQVMNQRDDIDVLIVGRGGGSIEDLWSFNEERVARAIFASTIPVVSAVGHETDYTISDMVADHRAPTPSAAIEHIVPDQDELFAQLDGLDAWLRTTIQNQLNSHEARIQELETRLAPEQRKGEIYQLYQTVDNLDLACRSAVGRNFSDSENRLHTLAQRLDALSPLATLKRGYSISRKTDGAVVTTAEQVSVGDRIEVQLAQGHLACRVEEFLSEHQLSDKETD